MGESHHLDHTQNWAIKDSEISITKTNSFADKESIIKSWANNLQQSAKRGRAMEHTQIAIALPGPFDYKKGLFEAHPEGEMGSLAGNNLRNLLLPYFGKNLKISFENDAACFGLGEACFGESKHHPRSIGITLGTGIGSSFIAEQKIVKVAKNIPFGGELYAEPFGNGIADDYFSTRWFVQQAAKDLSIEVSGVRELTEKANTPYLQELFEKFANYLYQFLLPYAINFKAKIIIIGGNIAKAWRFFGQHLNRLFAQNQILVQPSSLNEKAIMLGAAKVFLQK